MPNKTEHSAQYLLQTLGLQRMSRQDRQDYAERVGAAASARSAWLRTGWSAPAPPTRPQTWWARCASSGAR